MVWTGETPARFQASERLGRFLAVPEPVARADGRWPVECGQGCGYRFTDDDPRQPWQELLYLRPSTGDRYTIHPPGRDSFPPPGVLVAGAGASYDAWWYPDAWRGADGISLIVRCPRPDGSPGPAWDWCVDMPSSTGGRWTRSGDPRAANVTASPSIAIGDPGEPGHYHGFLQSGVLTDHLG
jgi:hypothetical protein